MSNYKVHLPGGEFYVNDTWVAKYTPPEEYTSPDEWQYYMRRGNRHYFRNIWTGAKINILAPELKNMNMKYGEKYEFKFET